MTTLNDTIKFNSLGGAVARTAKKQAEEATTRFLVGANKASGDLKKTCSRVVKATLWKVPSLMVDSEAVDMITDVGVAYNTGHAIVNGYSAGKKFVKGYTECTDKDVQELKALLDITEDEE